MTDRAAAYWSGQAERYHRWGDLAHGHPRYRQAWTAALGELVGSPAGDQRPRIVEVGTGTGELAILLAAMGHRVTAFDVASGMLERARANVAAVDNGGDGSTGRVRLARAAAHRLPLEDSSVDLVISRMVFWALADPVDALREWRRVLTGTGRIVVIDALHFRPPENGAGRIRHRAGQAFWSALERIDRWRGTDSPDGGSRPASPGASWRSVAEPVELFARAGLSEPAVGWLDDVADAQRRTARLRWRLVGGLPRFYTLTWDARP